MRPGPVWKSILFLICSAVGACNDQASAPVRPAQPAPVAQPAASAQPAPGGQPAQPATPSALSGKSTPDCIAPFTTQGETGELKLGGRTFKRTGAMLSVTNPDADHHVVLGTLGNVKEATPENLANIKKYVQFWKHEKAEALLVAGDSGDTVEEIEGSLEAIAASDLPVFVIPGNREPRKDFQDAITAVSKRHPGVINMTQIRLVNFDDVSVVSLPGYYDKRFLNAGADGCQYFKEDVDALAPIVAAATSPVVLLSHAEPHGHGHEAIDAFTDGNAGDVYLQAFIKAHAVPFGIFANMHEAGGHATDIDSNVVRAGEPHDHLYLNAGPADFTDWLLNDGTHSHGMVETLTLDGGKASFKVFRAPEFSAAEQASFKQPTTAKPEPKGTPKEKK